MGYENVEGGVRVTFSDGTTDEADAVLAADGIHSVARPMIVQDEPVSSAYVAYRGAVPIELAAENGIDPSAVQAYVGPGYHFVQYALRAGEMFNQAAVSNSPKALRGEDDWGTPDELDTAFEQTCDPVRKGLPLMWRDRWWRMFDRDPIMNWLNGRIALLGDAAHPPLQYMAQGAIMAIEDGWVLAQHVERLRAADGAIDGRRAGRLQRGASRALPPHPVDRPDLGRVVAPARRGAAAAQRCVRRHRPARLGVHRLGVGAHRVDPQDEPEMFTKIPINPVHV